MSSLRFLFILALVCLGSWVVATDDCNCKNNAKCSPLNRCLCPANFIGQHCEVPAKLISDKPSYVGVFNEYAYFYFQPNEVNFYKLNFTICMMSNPSRSDTLFFIQTERNNGSMRSIPSLFETAKLVLGADGCVNFMTHYISIKRREDETYRRIIIGLKPMEKNDTNHYLNVYRSSSLLSLTLQETVSKQTQERDQLPHFQEIKITMNYQLYLHNNYYSSYIVLFASSTLIIIFMVFISSIRKRYAQAESDETITLEDFRVEVNINNPERSYRMRKNNLTIVQIFMPATIYGQCSKYFHSECLGSIRQEPSEYPQHETCPICLIDFMKDDEIRMTPCRHRYHRDCIDDWCQSNLSCPICRQALDFSKQIRLIYYHYLRGDLLRSRGPSF